MKSANLEAEILKTCTKICNLSESVGQMQSKLRKLEDELEKYRETVHKEGERLASFGQKTPRRDGKTETPEDLNKKKQYNQDLYKLKLEMIKKHFPENYAYLESLLPDPLKDENLN